MKFTAMCSVVLTVGISVASAHDLVPPEWRGDPGSTVQMWSFDQNSTNPVAPEYMVNPYGGAYATIQCQAPGDGWVDTLLGQQGLWDLGPAPGNMVFDIMNQPVSNPYKEVLVQVTFYNLFGSPTVDVPGGMLQDSGSVDIDAPQYPGKWSLAWSLWRIEPNPSQEQVLVNAPAMGALVDQVVIDTICVPEPASLSLLGIGLAGLLRRKMRA